MKLTEKEQTYFDDIRQRINKLQHFLQNDIPETDDPIEWFKYIAAIRKIQGNSSNDQSFLATMLAKEYLKPFNLLNYDAAEKPQGAAGLDIDERTEDGRRIIAEIKTTYPYKENDLGSAQWASFKKDFDKLKNNEADEKFFFVTHQKTFKIVTTRYADEVADFFKVVLLIDSSQPD